MAQVIGYGIPVLLLTVSIFSPHTVGEYTYIGCYENMAYSVNGVSEMIVNDCQGNTKSSCGRICEEAGFRYAGLQNGDSCMCGNSFDRYRPSAACGMPCPGDSTQTCGNTTSASVYATGKACFIELTNQEFYYIDDPSQQSVESNGEVNIKQYSRHLGLSECRKTCASDPDCIAYAYYTDTPIVSNFGERCYGFTLAMYIGDTMDRQGITSGRMIPCDMYDSDGLAGYIVGLVAAIFVLLATILILHKLGKKK